MGGRPALDRGVGHERARGSSPPSSRGVRGSDGRVRRRGGALADLDRAGSSVRPASARRSASWTRPRASGGVLSSLSLRLARPGGRSVDRVPVGRRSPAREPTKPRGSVWRRSSRSSRTASCDRTGSASEASRPRSASVSVSQPRARPRRRRISELPTFPDDDSAWRLHWRRGRAAGRARAAGGGTRRIRRLRGRRRLAAETPRSATASTVRTCARSCRCSTRRSSWPWSRATARRPPGFIDLVKARALSSALSIRPQARGERSGARVEFDEVAQRLDALEFQGYRGDVAGPEAYQQRVELLARRLSCSRSAPARPALAWAHRAAAVRPPASSRRAQGALPGGSHALCPGGTRRRGAARRRRDRCREPGGRGRRRGPACPVRGQPSAPDSPTRTSSTSPTSG